MDRSRERSERREPGSRDDDDYRRSRDRAYDRRRDDRGDNRRRRSRSWSDRRTRSRSPSKSKRVSGFDKAPPASAMLAIGAAVTAFYERRLSIQLSLCMSSSKQHE